VKKKIAAKGVRRPKCLGTAGLNNITDNRINNIILRGASAAEYSARNSTKST